jgi:hypothetical protein
MSFQITALDPGRFARYFNMSDTELTENRAARCIATTKPGFPCRVSLADADVDDELILVNYAHQDGDSPYRASHAIFVRKGVAQARPEVGEVPELFHSRALSLRAFSDQAMIVAADLVDGKVLASSLDRLLGDPCASYVHIHYAKFGCYAARADRI